MTDYTADILSGGTASSSDSIPSHEAGYGCDNDESTYCYLYPYADPNWWKYDLGASVTKKVCKLRIKSVFVGSEKYGVKDWILYGSNDSSNYTQITSDTQANNDNWQEYVFANTVSYRYYKLTFPGGSWGGARTIFYELEMMEEMVYAPETPSTPSGDTPVVVGTSHSYSTAATDPGGYNIYYTFDWGDGSGYESTGWYASGQTGSLSHAFATPGTKYVRVYATNSGGVSSGWSDSLTVVVVTAGRSTFRLVGIC